MSRLTNQMTVTVAGLRGPGLDSADVAVIEGATQEARRAAGFPTLAEANTFAPNMTTGQRTTVSNTDTGTHAAVAGEVRLDGTAATVGEAIPNGGVYEKQAGGALLRVGSTEDQLAGVQSARAEAAAARLGATQTVGRSANSPPVAGTTAENGVCVIDGPATADGEWGRIRYYAAADDVLRLASVALSGLNVTVAESASVAVVAGYNDIDLVGRLPIKAGQYPALIAPASNRSVAAAADGNGFWTATASTASRAFTLSATKVTTRRLQVSIDLVGYAPDNIKDRQKPYRRRFTIGRTATPTAGSAGLPLRNYVIDSPATEYVALNAVRLYAGAGGSVRVDKVTKSGDTYTKVPGSPVLNIDGASGSAVTAEASSLFVMAPGEYLRLRPSAANLLRANSASPERFFQGYLDNGSAADEDSFTDATVSVSGVEIGFDFAPFDPADTNYERIAARVAATTGGGGSDDDYGDVDPNGYMIVWMLGQSNIAGRGPTRSTRTFGPGQAYKLTRSTGVLVPMTDPTGNDANALENGGMGSSGPAVADRIRQLSRGKIGCIIVNSAEGGTKLSQWNVANSNRRTVATSDWNAALASAAALKLPIVGASACWGIGETDAVDGTTKADYKAGMVTLRDWTRSVAGPKLTMAMMRIGTPDNGDAPGFVTIRQAQQELAEADEGFRLVHTDALYYYERGLMNTGYHYAQSCYEDIGLAFGDAAYTFGMGLRPLGYNA